MAAACGRPKTNYNDIFVINSLTGEVLESLKGNNVMISEIIWSPRDIYLFSCGHDGFIFEWSVANFARKDFHVPDCKLLSMAI